MMMFHRAVASVRLWTGLIAYVLTLVGLYALMYLHELRLEDRGFDRRRRSTAFGLGQFTSYFMSFR